MRTHTHTHIRTMLFSHPRDEAVTMVGSNSGIRTTFLAWVGIDSHQSGAFCSPGCRILNPVLLAQSWRGSWGPPGSLDIP